MMERWWWWVEGRDGDGRRVGSGSSGDVEGKVTAKC